MRIERIPKTGIQNERKTNAFAPVFAHVLCSSFKNTSYLMIPGEVVVSSVHDLTAADAQSVLWKKQLKGRPGFFVCRSRLQLKLQWIPHTLHMLCMCVVWIFRPAHSFIHFTKRRERTDKTECVCEEVVTSSILKS